MLVLSHEVDDIIYIIDSDTDEVIIEIEILRINRGQVRTGYIADKRYRIIRHDAVKQEGAE